MENVFLTSLTTPEVRQMFRDELTKFFPEPLTTKQAHNPEIITGDELCKKLNVTTQTLIKWRQKGKIPYLQLGASIRYDLEKVLDALEVTKKKVRAA